jgi:uncharacterized protein
MSALQTVQHWYATGDIRLLHLDVVWQVLPSFPAGGTYQGRAAVSEEFFPAIRKHFAEYGAHPAAWWVAGETVIIRGKYQGETRDGRAFASDFIHIWQVEDGVIRSLDQVADTAVMPT